MKLRIAVALVALVLLVLPGAAFAQIQNITSEVAFAFVAGGKELPAGKYTFEASSAGPMVLTGPKGVRMMLPVLTLLARHAQDQHAGLVFDQVDGKNTLSEVWMPGRDGLLLVATKEAHRHSVVPAADAKK